jgi:DNA polymerase-3 subunit epsilon/ATP-dependent DNA helicase DinG
VIDEAHHLEEEATRQLGVDISERSLMLPLQALTPTPTLDLAAALEASIDMLAHRDDGEPHRAESPMVKLRQCLADAAGDTGELFDAVQALVVGAQNSESTSTVRLTQSVRGRDTWALVEERWERLRGCLREVDHHATNLLDHIGAAADAGSEGATSLNTEWLAATQQLRTVCARLDSLICEAPEDMVCWASCNTSLGGGASTELHMVPLDVAQAMRDAFFEQKDAVVLTSATLTTEGSFDYMRQRLGAFEADELAVGSPFDYERGVLLVLPSDMPDPASPTYASRAADAVAEMAEALGGRTLALFTSYAQLRSVHGTIRARMERAQISLLAQGVDGSRTRLLQRFRSAERALLLGTASFWEGVDIPGEALSALIIGRLPFAVPVDPVFAARSEQFEAPFLEYALPQAVLRFKQGFGRLIRTKNDRGVVLVLDGRIVSKLYGSSFVNSLPTCTVKRAPVGTAAALAREWLAGDPIPILERGGSA